MIEIMPPERKWDQATEELAETLVKGATERERAALALVFRSPLFESDEFRTTYIRTTHTGGQAFDWDHLRDDLGEHYWPMSAAVAAQLHIAGYLAHGLGFQMSHLDTTGARHVGDVLRMAMGR